MNLHKLLHYDFLHNVYTSSSSSPSPHPPPPFKFSSICLNVILLVPCKILSTQWCLVPHLVISKPMTRMPFQKLHLNRCRIQNFLCTLYHHADKLTEKFVLHSSVEVVSTQGDVRKTRLTKYQTLKHYCKEIN